MVKSFDEFIKEGMFSGMVRRSNSNIIKKEEILNLDLDGFLKYINEIYEVKSGFDNIIYKFSAEIIIPIYYFKNPKNGVISTERMYVVFEYNTKIVHIGLPIVLKQFDTLWNILSNDYNVKTDNDWIHIKDKTNELDTSVVLDIIDTVINNIGENALIKKK